MPTGPVKPGLQRPTILVTTVDIGGGKSDLIEIRRGDDPAECARDFCALHGLPDAVVVPLTEHLLDNLRRAALAKATQNKTVSNMPPCRLPPVASMLVLLMLPVGQDRQGR